MPVRDVGHIGDMSVHLHTDVQSQFAPMVKLIKTELDRDPGMRLTLDESVELARLLIKTAAANGWGSDDPDRLRIIAWAQVKHG